MFRLCIPFPLADLIAGGAVLTLGALLLVHIKSRQGNGQIDGNERLILQLSILAVFAIIVFVLFILTWKPC